MGISRHILQVDRCTITLLNTLKATLLYFNQGDNSVHEKVIRDIVISLINEQIDIGRHPVVPKATTTSARHLIYKLTDNINDYNTLNNIQCIDVDVIIDGILYSIPVRTIIDELSNIIDDLLFSVWVVYKLNAGVYVVELLGNWCEIEWLRCNNE